MKRLRALSNNRCTSHPNPGARLLLARHIQKPLSPQLGFSLVYALVIGFGAIVLAAALGSRTFYSVFGASFNQDARRARDAAETGASRIVSELNRERNRAILSIPTSSSPIWTSAQATGNPNLCAVNSAAPGIIRPFTADIARIATGGAAGTAPTPSSSAPVGPVVYVSANGIATSTNSFTISQNSPNGEPYAYQLERVEVPNAPRNADWTSSNAPRRGELRLLVRGYSFNNGRLAGSTVVEQTLEIVPKCCNLSFGGNGSTALGNDNRDCNSQINNPGFGFLFGTGLSSDGTVVITGVKSSIENLANGDPVTPLVCQSSTTSTCPATATVGTQSVPVVQVGEPIDPPQQFIETGITSPGSNPTPQAFNYFDRPSSEPEYADSNATCTPGGTTFVTACEEGSGGNRKQVRLINVATVDLASLPSNCGHVNDTINERRADGTTISRNFTSIHCNVTRLVNSNGELYRFLTSDTRRLVLHFPEEDQSGGSGSRLVVNGDLEHCDNSTTAGCRDENSVSANPLLRLNFLGCPRVTAANERGCINNGASTASNTNTTNSRNIQSIILRGNSTAAAQPFFLYFPTGEVTINGGGGTADQIRGMLWVNEVSGSGNVEIAIPGSGIGDILNLYTDGAGATTPGGGGGSTPFIHEFIARAVRQFRILPGG